jgi:hypothetical protein
MIELIRRTERQRQRADRIARKIQERLPKISDERADQTYEIIYRQCPDELYLHKPVPADPRYDEVNRRLDEMVRASRPPGLSKTAELQSLLFDRVYFDLDKSTERFHQLLDGKDMLLDGIQPQEIAAAVVELINEELLHWSDELAKVGFNPPGTEISKWVDVARAIGNTTRESHLRYGDFADAGDQLIAMNRVQTKPSPEPTQPDPAPYLGIELGDRKASRTVGGAFLGPAEFGKSDFPWELFRRLCEAGADGMHVQDIVDELNCPNTIYKHKDSMLRIIGCLRLTVDLRSKLGIWRLAAIGS